MRKKIALVLILCLVLCCSLIAAVACNDATDTPSDYNEGADLSADTEAVRFDADVYEIADGIRVTANGKASYFIVGKAPDGIRVSDNGTFSVADTVANGTQVLLGAKSGGKCTDTTVCTVVAKVEAPELEITNLSDYLISGDTAEAVASPAYSISYTLKDDYVGIKVNSVTGKVTFTEAVTDGTPFTVVVSSHGAVAEKNFVAAVGNYVTAEKDEAIAELGVGTGISFTLDFGTNADAEAEGILGVTRGHNRLSAHTDYAYDSATNTLTLTPRYASGLGMGINMFRIVTAKNAVAVQVKIAKYVTSAEELAAINDSQENLRGFYVLACDLDLTKYLAVGGKGYDSGNRWKPIGVYYDRTDGTATDWAFAGEFDGNGHVISGLSITRSDNFAFNSGLFGCVSASGIVKNLGVKGFNNVKSFSGGMVGYNMGKVYDCWADVDVTADGCRILGGFVGKNEGTVKNCYSLGKASGESYVGSFCGDNMGIITDCYAVQNKTYAFSGSGSATNCALASDSTNLAKMDYSSWSNWQHSAGSLPVLPSLDLEYPLKSVVVNNTETHLTRGDSLQLDVTTNPSSAAANGLTFEIVQGNGATVTAEGLLSVRNAQAGEYVTVRITCGEIYADYTVWVYAKVNLQQTAFVDTEDVMYADGHYRVNCAVLPATANQKVTYSITGATQGVSIKGDVISIAPNVQSGTFNLVATLADGEKVQKQITVVGDTLLDPVQLDRQNLTDVQLSLPQSGLTVSGVKIFGKEAEFTCSGDTVVIAGSQFVKYGSEPISVLIQTESGEKFRVIVTIA
ncbi:MAG: hypothetical protein NC132_03605 [Corallococcus sp.]|nr:hypothetical protein [Corallococcus sp.]MCM1395179.1 hypothetical protein [Corallococcus sp.]